jgi:CheY-like chemotaxis protein
VDASSITVATPDPDAAGLREPIAFATGKRVIAVLGLAGVLQQLIGRAFEELSQGGKVLKGGPKAGSAAQVVVATPTSPLSDADQIAKAIIDAADGGESAQKKIGAVRLKRVLATKQHEPPPVVMGEEFDENTLDRIPLALSSEESTSTALVVDDDPDIRRMLSRLLAVDGIAVREAADGTQAVAYLRSERPQVALLDAMLPGVHGFEICRAMKQSEVMKGIPVIMISAVYRGWVLAREITEVHGADYFVEKPFDTQYVRRLVAEVLKRPAPRAPKAQAVQERIAAQRERYEQHAEKELWFACHGDVASWLSLDPFDARAWLERGNLRAQSGDLVGAMSDFETATIYDGSMFFAHVALAHVSERLGFVRRARASWEKARGLAPDDGTRAQIEAHLARPR